MPEKVRWRGKRRKSGAYVSRCGRYILAPITAPTGPDLPSYILFGMRDGKVAHELGSHHSPDLASTWLFNRGIYHVATKD